MRHTRRICANTAPVTFVRDHTIPKGPKLTDSVLSTIQRRLEGLQRYKLKDDPKVRKASVLIPLVEVADESCMLFTLRSADLSTHSGQVSFPGGHIENHETAEQAAIREYGEELGVETNSVQTLGRFHDAIAITGTHVFPVVASLPRLTSPSELRPSLDEVTEAFTVPLRLLVDPSVPILEKLSPTKGRENSLRDRPTHIPAFVSAHFPSRIWGLTGYLLDRVLRDIIIPSFRDDGISTTQLPDLPDPSDLSIIDRHIPKN